MSAHTGLTALLVVVIATGIPAALVMRGRAKSRI
jgi:hypothetical protein